jgi:hypothetical protein
VKQLLVIAFLLIAFHASHAQEGHCPKIPENYSWETAEDYRKDKDLVKKTLRWLCSTPLGVDIEKRGLANAYVLEWLAGSPSITVDIKTEHLPFLEHHPDLLYSFIHGIALYLMDKPTETDTVKLYAKGFEVVATLAMQSKELSHDKDFKPLIKAYKKERMMEFVRQTLEQNEKI